MCEIYYFIFFFKKKKRWREGVEGLEGSMGMHVGQFDCEIKCVRVKYGNMIWYGIF